MSSMRAYENDGDFTTYTVTDTSGEHVQGARPDEEDCRGHMALRDPGMQFDTTINKWHTSKNTSRHQRFESLSEYMFLDNSACNLSSSTC